MFASSPVFFIALSSLEVSFIHPAIVSLVKIQIFIYYFLYFSSQLPIHVFLMATNSMSGISDYFSSFLNGTWLYFHVRNSLNNTDI